jgi:capsular exopolysaccharide synthesis family protein
VGPSDGKTLTAFNLACACAQLEETSVLLVDADLRTRGLSQLIPDLPSGGLANYLAGTGECENIALRTNLNGLFVVGAGESETSPAELFSRGRWQQFLNWAKSQFKLVIVDSLPVGVVADSDLITGACDKVLIVLRALKASRTALEDALGHLDTNKILGVVWNGAQKSPDYYGAR